MKVGVLALSVFVALVTSTNATVEDGSDQDNNIAYDYIRKVALPLAKRIHKAEKQAATVRKIFKIKKPQEPFMKIIDGTAAKLGDFPYQAGIIGNFDGGIISCGGSLLTANRVLTAAHCWWDGVSRVRMFTVVLGSVTLFRGGVRMHTSKVITHDNWNPRIMRNDIAMVYLPRTIKFTEIIQPIALPSCSSLLNSFVGYSVYASGYGNTRGVHGNTRNAWKSLNYAELQVITNEQCSWTHGYVSPSEMCTWSNDYRNICNGDSGGPLAVLTQKGPILIGITSYGVENCESGRPSGYTRVTAYINWIHRHL